MENIIHNCANCKHCDEDCAVCLDVKQNNDGSGCIFWIEDTADLGIKIDDEKGVF